MGSEPRPPKRPWRPRRWERRTVPSDNVGRNLIGYGMGAPTVVAHGTAEQQNRWLRKLFTAEEIWCQLFSEPGAGSDAAGIGTRAMRDGDEWVVNGQKVWTTLGHTAKWGMLTARTNPAVPKHRGITYFIIDMDQPGVGGATATPDHRRGRVQRDLLHRRPGSRRQPTGRSGGGVGESR